MNTSTRAQEIIGEAVTSVQDVNERRQLAQDLMFYALGTLIAIDGPKRGAEAAYRAADAAVGVK